MTMAVGSNLHKKNPNVILIFVDDMGYGDPGCYGGQLVPTPGIDRLASGGMRFTQGYVSAPVCGPSRYGLLSGAYQNRFGVYWNPLALSIAGRKGEYTQVPCELS
ncbi:MAG: sulfatase-like hydrolase/transferase [Planctomycetes bacterium]|nr:sulfatase-like hydrolase/transferase [Planctomycetota bacterium]